MALTYQKLKKEIEKVFRLIEDGKTKELEEKKVKEYKSSSLYSKFIQGNKYPDIEFHINDEEFDIINTFVDIVNNLNENRAQNIAEKLNEGDSSHSNALAKFFYSLSWKQGDLGKLNTLLAGLQDVYKGKPDKEKTSAVFTQFGRHLAKPDKHPIIDQHIIRAYNFYMLVIKDEEDLNENLLNSGNKNIAKNKSERKNIFRFKDDDINCFLEWHKEHVPREKAAIRSVDKCLFTLGRALNSDSIKSELRSICKE